MEKYFEINNNGISIKCKIYCNDIRNVKDVVISCHGFGGSKENMASKKLAKKLMEIQNDIAVIVFDWPCHGKDVRQKIYLSDCNNYLNTLIDFISIDGADHMFKNSAKMNEAIEYSAEFLLDEGLNQKL